MPTYYTKHGAHFTNDFPLTIQIIRQHINLFLIMKSRQNFAHATTAQLSWHVQNFTTVTPVKSELEQKYISIELRFRGKNISRMAHCHVYHTWWWALPVPHSAYRHVVNHKSSSTRTIFLTPGDLPVFFYMPMPTVYTTFKPPVTRVNLHD